MLTTIKIIRKRGLNDKGKVVELYDLYYGFRGITTLFFTKWIDSEKDMTEERLMEMMYYELTTVGRFKVIVEVQL